jgi:hypothetical protein
MKRSILCMLAMIGLAVSACKKEESSAPDPRAVAHSKTMSPDQPSSAQLPVPEDFEAEAEREITEDNYKDALDTIAKEIEASE